MISSVFMEILQGKDIVCAKKTPMKRQISDETVLNVTQYGYVKAVRIMVTVVENLVSIDNDTTSEPVNEQFISLHGGIVERAIRHRPHLGQNQSRGKR
jgi:hypothetical protein